MSFINDIKLIILKNGHRFFVIASPPRSVLPNRVIILTPRVLAHADKAVIGRRVCRSFPIFIVSPRNLSVYFSTRFLHTVFAIRFRYLHVFRIVDVGTRNTAAMNGENDLDVTIDADANNALVLHVREGLRMVNRMRENLDADFRVMLQEEVKMAEMTRQRDDVSVNVIF